ncbi:PDR/VanB family oxidoreductase [Mycobacterium sp. 21AC1]|uniref:PDR/VanB family oxidoreductase n=1 Tax=[Mycobacterium] appelbergii TaxID=2939269 RepID=UPI002938FE83|nr:PDR/VanB family oxidoreductase [Mycobacterium sp. 21AC1]MDV3127996.1 PDR/VanB family oxidoreductase [Mycobacterium sp. 21AC1]
MKLQVTQLRLEAADVISVMLRSPAGDRLPEWAAGAHVTVTLPSGLMRQYSLCGRHDDPYSYTIAVLLVGDGRGGSREIHQGLRIGDFIEVGTPRNNFSLTPAHHYLFVAGGIGVTPILAMIEALRGEPDPPRLRLLYGGRSRAAMAFLDRLDSLDGVEVVPQDEAGLPDLAGAFENSPAGTHVYCCGPPAMLAAAQRLSALHPELHLHFERFTAGTEEVARVDDGAFEVELARSGITITVPKDKSVLDAVLEVAPGTEFSCTSGFCGTCETKVLSGQVDHRDGLLTDDERRAGASMMICVSRSLGGDKLTLDL